MSRSCVYVLHDVDSQGFSGDIDLFTGRVLESECLANSEEDGWEHREALKVDP